MEKKKIIMISIFAIGISLLLYPRIGNIITSYNQKKSIKQYINTVEVLDEKNNQELYEQAIKYNEKIYEYKKSKKRYNLDEEYKHTLQLNETGIIGYIQIPKVNIELPIYHSVEEKVLQKGVGHVKESSLPVGSPNQNSVLMGHSGLPISRIFTNLEKLKVDDYIIINILNKTIYYRIIKTEVIEPSEVIDRLAIEEGKDLITLVTCTPYGINSHRFIIRAERTEEVPPDLIEKTKEQTKGNLPIIILTVICIIVLITIGTYIFVHIKNKKEQLRIEEEKLQLKKKPQEKETVKKVSKTNNKKKKKKKKKKKTTRNNNTKKKNKKKRGKKNAKKR